MSQKKILVVDDEKEIANLVRDFLIAEGFEVVVSYDGEEGMNAFKQHKPDLAVLDIMLPKKDGMEVCRAIRSESSIPIIMLSAKKSDIDKVLGLGLGADDYVTKPFSPVELVARIKAHLRRYTQLSSKESNADILTFEKLKIYLESYKVTIEGREISLTAKEFETLRLLASSPSRVYTREQIFNQVWGFNEYGDINTVTVHIKKIREKIEDDPSHPEYIKTVWGVGYKFDGGI
jgi:DNA-binding response OmpR family regulator